MLTIPNLPTQDKYVDALTIGPVPTAVQLKYVVANKAVFARIWPKSRSGTIMAQTDELLITPETNIITNAMGMQFRSAVPGVPAQVIAQLLEPGDPLLGSGTPFSATISGSGAIQPGVSSVQIQKDGALIGTEPTLDVVTGGMGRWTMSDDAANTRVLMQLEQRPRIILRKAGVSACPSAGGANVTWDTLFEAINPANGANQWWNAGVNPHQIILPYAGMYSIQSTIVWASLGAPAGFEVAQVLNVAGGAWAGDRKQTNPVAGEADQHTVSYLIEAAAGAVIFVQAYQVSGGARNFGAGDGGLGGSTQLVATWLGN